MYFATRPKDRKTEVASIGGMTSVHPSKQPNRNTGIHRIGVITFSFFVRLWMEYVRDGGRGKGRGSKAGGVSTSVINTA